MSDVSIIYYSSNREDQAFEKRIQDNILKQCGDIPIISVTQKPTDFGQNICVGDVGASGFNCFRQILIAAETAKTKFVLSCEADCMYPPSYFCLKTAKTRREDRCYRVTNLYVMPDLRAYWFHKPEGATHAQIVGRDFYVERLRQLFTGAPEWSVEEKNFPKERLGKDDIFERKSIIHYETEEPIFQVKTHQGLRYYTRSERVPIDTLPYWGKAQPWRDYLIKGIAYDDV